MKQECQGFLSRSLDLIVSAESKAATIVVFLEQIAVVVMYIYLLGNRYTYIYC